MGTHYVGLNKSFKIAAERFQFYLQYGEVQDSKSKMYACGVTQHALVLK